ncbi:MAG TPA: hypothetical protein VJG64_01015 [Candidatus Paceibacterota bacterium]
MKEPRKVTFKSLDAKLDTFVTLMVEGFEAVRGDIAALQTDMTEMKSNHVEVQGTQEAHGKAIDKDAVTLINHESRIKKLEVVG